MSSKVDNESTLHLAVINHQGTLMACVMASVYEKSIGSDVTFSVEGKQFKAHRAILAAQSQVFEKMLLGTEFREANKDEVVDLPDKNADSFEVFLKYFYTFKIKVGCLGFETIIELLYMAHEYQVNQLITALATALEAMIDEETALPSFECAHLLGLKDLLEKCRNYIDENATRMIKNSHICYLSKSALIDLISSEQFCAPEIDILFAVQDWYKRHPGENVRDVLNYVSLAYVSLDGTKMSRIVALGKLLTENGIDLEIVGSETSDSCSRKSQQFTRDLATENVSTVACGAIVEGLGAEQLGYFFHYKSSWTGYLSYEIPIVIKLVNISGIGSLSFDIYCEQFESFGPCFYKIETSQNKRQWKSLVDCQNEPFLRDQLIMFTRRDFQYIRLTAFKVPDFGPSVNYSVEAFQCPATAISTQEATLYAKWCPNGETLVYQRKCGSVKVFPTRM